MRSESAPRSVFVDRRRDSRRDPDRQRMLAELSSSLAETITDTDTVLNRMVRLISTFCGDTTVVRIIEEDGVTMRVAAAHDADPAVRDALVTMLRSVTNDLRDLIPYSEAVRESSPVLVTGEGFAQMLAAMDESQRHILRRIDAHSVLLCPLRVHARVIGTLGLWRRGDRPAHSERDQRFAQECADRAALAIENARLVARLRDEIEESHRNEDNLRLTAELLTRADDKRRTLIEHLVTAQEEERRRIAVDVHDDSIQAMAAIGLRLQVLRRHAPNDEFGERIAEIEETVTESIGRLRSLLFRLESSSLEKAGLARTLIRYAGEMFPDGTPRVHIRNSLDTEPPAPVQVVLYRIGQEAISNVRKHAQASNVTITLSSNEAGLLLEVADDGAGFDSEQVTGRALPGHLGLRAMEERARMAGGWVRVASTPGEGTRMTTWLPSLDPAAEPL